MISENKKQQLREVLPLYVQSITEKAKDYNKLETYICPLCGSGTGKKHKGKGTAAFCLYRATDSWCCYGCDKTSDDKYLGGDIFDLVKLHEGITDFEEQARFIADFANIDLNDDTHYQPKKRPDPVVVTPQKGQYKEYIKQCHADAGLTDYWKSRGFDSGTINRFMLGYDRTKNSVTIPYGKDGSYYIQRSVEGKRFFKPKIEDAGQEPVYNQEALNDTKPCFICESPIDAISIIEASEGRCNAVAIGGTGASKLIRQLQERKPECDLIVSLDNDEAGKTATSEISRELIKAGLATMAYKAKYSLGSYTNNKDANDLFISNREQLKKDIHNLIDGIASGTVLTIDRIEEEEQREAYFKKNNATEWLKRYDNEIIESADQPYYPTGYDLIDKAFDGGLYPGLYAIGAAPSVGKTTFLLQMADQIAAAGYDVMFFSLEMAATELVAKSISRIMYQKDSRKAKTLREVSTYRKLKTFSKAETDTLNEAKDTYRQIAKHLYLFEGLGNIGTAQIKEEVEKHIDLTGSRPVVVIDYLQLLAPEDVRASDKQNIDRAVLELKRLSRDCRLPVMVVSSFNRETYKGDKDADLASFKESGSIEYSSDVLLTMERKGDKTGNRQTIKFTLHKNRNGERGGKITLDFVEPYSTFEESNKTGKMLVY